jgi:hypothetical protein
MTELTTGTVSFLFTDIEGSIRLWEPYRQPMPAALVRHDALLHHAIENHSGPVSPVLKTVEDPLPRRWRRHGDDDGS